MLRKFKFVTPLLGCKLIIENGFQASVSVYAEQ